MSRSGGFDSIEARIIRRAQAVKGGAASLAAHLEVELAQLEAWSSGAEPPPEAVLEKALDLLVEWKLSQWPRG